MSRVTMFVREIRLPCSGIRIRLDREHTPNSPGCSTIISDLHAPGRGTEVLAFNAAIDGLESLILAHACAGVDVQAAAYVQGIETAVNAITNQV
jgi:hypothetical protein